VDKAGNRRIISRQLQFLEMDSADATRSAGYAPYQQLSGSCPSVPPSNPHPFVFIERQAIRAAVIQLRGARR
jgi:hypothetical protein